MLLVVASTRRSPVEGGHRQPDLAGAELLLEAVAQLVGPRAGWVRVGAEAFEEVGAAGGGGALAKPWTTHSAMGPVASRPSARRMASVESLQPWLARPLPTRARYSRNPSPSGSAWGGR